MVLHEAYLRRCNYNDGVDRYCPRFRLGTILDIVEPKSSEQRRI